jgi:hypothetical protein
VLGLAGQMDPNLAASEYLVQAAQALQSDGVANPTVLQVRGYYNFGPSGAAITTASPDETMTQVMPNVSATTFQNNGVTPSENGQTVGSVCCCCCENEGSGDRYAIAVSLG